MTEPTAEQRVANAGMTANDYRHEPLYPNGKPVVHVDWTPERRDDHAELRGLLDELNDAWPQPRAPIRDSIRQLLAEHDARP